MLVKNCYIYDYELLIDTIKSLFNFDFIHTDQTMKTNKTST